ncbi:hypothetical protein ASPTUDRAFT_830568 [Aspergillus tubingensis CBS 134.48]|uniref:Secreted protein n=1 Tax=Aspergillus tubingensis (strain CBS 134.48) TaxID=767770 RepID=A0A1L9MWX8_ASPTC|nr:hypothetical protein ASPTUDRAFT_830568 [Aspergillus tubingensis CBS 134.48]
MVWLACMALGCLSVLGSERGILNGSCFFLYCLPVCTYCSSCCSSMGLICKFFLGTPDSVAGLGKLVPDRRHRPTSHTDMRRLSVGISSSGPINSRRTFALLWFQGTRLAWQWQQRGYSSAHISFFFGLSCGVTLRSYIPSRKHLTRKG